jgi:FKBP-type peptidyl-prolyl cis-trans isomerase
MKPKIIATEDGSHSLFLENMDESYHSTHGAIQESNHVFIEAGFKQIEKNEFTVLEVGLKEGKGEKPGLTDKVKCHYHGTLIDGTVFDSSVERKEPMEFPVNGVIKGWTEALQLMPVGSKWKLFVPAELAYGERQAGEKILPNSTLIFEVELLEVAKSKK